ncbi:MAG: hypothetical protein ACHQAY_27275 [Hyphomicrobiales bacterium]
MIWAAIEKEMAPPKRGRPAIKGEKRRRGAPMKHHPARMRRLASRWLEWVETQRIKSRSPRRMPAFRRDAIDREVEFGWLKDAEKGTLSNLIGEALAFLLDSGAQLVDDNTGLSASSLRPEYQEDRARLVKRVAKLAKHKGGARAEEHASIIRHERLMRAGTLSVLGIDPPSGGFAVYKPPQKK